MRRRDAAWVGCLVLFGAMTAMAQAPDAAGRAKLRDRIAALRGEVELLRMERDADAEQLKKALTDLRNLEDIESAQPEFSRMAAELKAKHGDGGAELPPLKAPPGGGGPPGFAEFLAKAAADTERDQKVATDIDKAMLQMLRPIVERKKKEFAARTAALHAKTLELEDLERQYREPVAAAILGERPLRDGVERCFSSREDVERVPILDPVPGDPTASCCVGPPNEDEIWRKIPEPWASSADRNRSVAAIFKIGEKVDPCKVYPLAGPCRLVHCHYKVTVTLAGAVPRTEAVFIDKDHLRRCVDASHAHAAKPDAPAVVRAALPIQAPAADSDLERRMTRMEGKLDRILKALDRPGREE